MYRLNNAINLQCLIMRLVNTVSQYLNLVLHDCAKGLCNMVVKYLFVTVKTMF